MTKAVYIKSPIDNNKYCHTNGSFTKHLRNNGLTFRDYFEIYILGHTPICSCLKPCTFYQNGLKSKHANTCGNEKCVGKLVSKTIKNWSNEQKKQNSLNKKAASAKITKKTKREADKKRRKTNLERHKVEWTTQSTTMKDKSVITKKERYNDPNYNNSIESQKKNANKTDKEKEKIAKKREKTNIERYNVSNPFFSADVLSSVAKSNNKTKEYILPSGKKILIRGFEGIALDTLLKYYSEYDLLIHDASTEYKLPIFDYLGVNGRKRKYYPDILIEKENKIIEVKSTYWWDGNGSKKQKYLDRLETNLRKAASVVENGINFELWLYDRKHKLKILTPKDLFNNEK